MAAAREGDRVRITYSVTLEDGTVYDFSESRDPLEFTIGENETIPALERGVVGMEPGSRKKIVIPADEITGVSGDTLARELGIRELPAELSGTDTEFVFAPGEEGDVAEVLLPGIAAARYSLAGRKLTFEITLLSIAEPAS